jgi:hypothetical protein
MTNQSNTAATTATTAAADQAPHTDARGCFLVVATPGEGLPPAFKLFATSARQKAIIRVAGGCKGFTPEASAAMMPFFLGGFAEKDTAGAITRQYKGVVFSGGTANANEDGDLADDMVTNVPAVLRAAYGVVAMSTTPRTADMALERKHGGLVVGDTVSTRIDYRQDAAAVMQKSASQLMDWDGDVPVYFDFMADLKEAGFQTGVITLNGGDITRDEIYGALSRGIPVIAVEGSLRETDAFIKAFRDGDWTDTCSEKRAKLVKAGKDTKVCDDIVAGCQQILAGIDKSLVSIVSLTDPDSLLKVMASRGLLV